MGLHIVVCIKSVVTRATGARIDRTPDLSEMNYFDRPALETALALRDSLGGTVTALTMGPPDTGREVLLEAMAMGADRGVLLSHPALAGCDTLATSTALCAALKKIAPFDLVLFGIRTSDSDTGQVGPQTAVRLGLPLVTYVDAVAESDFGLLVHRTVDEFVERCEVALPAALTIRPNAAVPRDIPLRGIEEAFRINRVETLDLEAVGLLAQEVGEAGSGTRLVSMKPIEKKRPCAFIEGTEEEKAEQLLNRLKQIGMIG